MRRLTRAEYASALVLGATVGYLFVVPVFKGLRSRPEAESFDISVFDMTTSVEEDAEIIVALKEFFDSNEVGIGHDGWTAWQIND